VRSRPVSVRIMAHACSGSGGTLDRFSKLRARFPGTPVSRHPVSPRRRRGMGGPSVSGGRDHLLLDHRPGRGVDRRGGGQGPATDDAPGDHLRAADRRHHLRSGRVDGGGRAPWQDFEGQEAGLAQILENIVGSSWPEPWSRPAP
jgi:hypothetical protein